MDKRIKWSIIVLLGAGLTGWGIYSQLPKENKELAAAAPGDDGQSQR